MSDVDRFQIDLGESAKTKPLRGLPAAPGRQAWPPTLPEQVRAVADTLAAAAAGLDEAALGSTFAGRGAWKKRLPGILLTLEALGRARLEGGRWRA